MASQLGPTRHQMLRNHKSFNIYPGLAPVGLLIDKLRMTRVLTLIWLCMMPMAAFADPLVVFAAASLKGPMDQALEGQNAVVSYGGSGALARQIDQGAPADVVVLANQEWIDWLTQQGRLHPDTTFDLFSNRLVLISATNGPQVPLQSGPLLDALNGGRLAIGLTRSVPAGQYARAAFENLGLWNDIYPHLAELDNVRSVLALVIRGEVPLGIVYATDVSGSDVSVRASIPAQLHPPIRYVGAVVADTDTDPKLHEAQILLNHIVTHSAFAEAGFLPVSP